MALKIVCDICGGDVAREDALRRKTTFVQLEGGTPLLTYTNDTEDFCVQCAEKEAEPFRKAERRGPRKRAVAAIKPETVEK